MLISTPDVVRKYKEHSAEFILKKYDWDSVVKQTNELYENINC